MLLLILHFPFRSFVRWMFFWFLKQAIWLIGLYRPKFGDELTLHILICLSTETEVCLKGSHCRDHLNSLCSRRTVNMKSLIFDNSVIIPIKYSKQDDHSLKNAHKKSERQCHYMQFYSEWKASVDLQMAGKKWAIDSVLQRTSCLFISQHKTAVRHNMEVSTPIILKQAHCIS